MTHDSSSARRPLRVEVWRVVDSQLGLSGPGQAPAFSPTTNLPSHLVKRLRWPAPSVWQICHHLCSLACMHALFHAGDSALLEPGPSDNICFHTDCVRWKVRRTISALTDNKDCCSSVNTQPPRFYFSPTTACPFCSVTNRGKPSVRACCIA